MSELPRYSRTPNVDESETEALVKGGRGSLDGATLNDPAPLYPPTAGGSSGSSGRRNVTYEYDPVYPRPGEFSRVLGIMGRDKEEAIMLVRKVFPALDDIPDERISFEAAFGEQPPKWTKLMDEVWPQFIEDPPARMQVIVADGPGEKQKRNRRECKIGLGIILAICIFIAIIITALSLDDSNKKK